MDAFARAIGVSRRSVAKVELGEEDAGPRVLRAVSRGIGLPAGNLVDYLRTGDRRLLSQPPAQRADASQADDIFAREIRDSFEREVMESRLRNVEERWMMVFDRRIRHLKEADTEGDQLRRTGD
jgi:transcriptional regulator with XRE-family HTH domain